MFTTSYQSEALSKLRTCGRNGTLPKAAGHHSRDSEEGGADTDPFSQSMDAAYTVLPRCEINDG